MSDFKITDFAAASALTGAELAELVQSGVNKKVTVQKLLEFVAAQLFIPYTSGTPATPAFPNVPAVAYDPTGALSTQFWSVSAQAWR